MVSLTAVKIIELQNWTLITLPLNVIDDITVFELQKAQKNDTII